MAHDTSVKVAVRIRPLLDNELTQNCNSCISAIPGEPQVVAGTDQCFTFDHVFGLESSQSDVFQDSVVNLVEATFEGFNATILAYGQTGSGKTFTMGSSSNSRLKEEQRGIIPRVIQSVFEEIYGEDIRDLLDPASSSKIIIRENPTGDVYVSGAREELVSSADELMEVLERGSLSRTTGSTLMNQTSSRSHAIFTLLLENTIHTSALDDDGPEVSSADGEESEVPSDSRLGLDLSTIRTTEVQRCKFHFVDLAGSERAKRTGAEGQRMREGIDINKGLLVLGNVISALGDEKKRGRTHVPYRDSKLTRMLQDSLGGNSKTLMICCVSPADTNLNESLNALRYANRARNIQNKPVINRDPTSVVISELKRQVQEFAAELLSVRLSRPLHEWGNGTPKDVLESLVSSMGSGRRSLGSSTPRPDNSLVSMSQSSRSKLLELQQRADSDCEIQRLTEQLKRTRAQLAQITEQSVLDRSERDYYRMKWADADPAGARLLESQRSQAWSAVERTGSDAGLEEQGDAIGREKQSFMSAVSGYLREIAALKAHLAEKCDNTRAGAGGAGDEREGWRRPSAAEGDKMEDELERDTEVESMEALLEGELTSSVARVIARTQQQLREEEKRLRALAADNGINKGDEKDELSGDDNAGEAEVEAVDRAFQRRQKLMSAEVVDLSESIKLKEQLVSQLQSSQRQYETMKTFYESKLQALAQEMEQKESEMIKLQSELTELAKQPRQESSAMSSHEAKLREKLLLKEQELQKMRSRQQELSHLSKVQSRHSDQMVKLQTEIENMKRQKISLSKSMQAEKKSHLAALTQKAREIERLKRDLSRSATELQQLGRDKERAEARAREAMKEGAALRKKADSVSFVFSTKAAKKALRSIPKPSGSMILSEDEMKVKKWLEQRVSDVAAKEEAGEALQRQCSEHLSLVRQRDRLLKEREDESKLWQELRGCAEDGEDPRLLREQEQSLAELDNKVSVLEEQLSVRASNIADMQRLLGTARDTDLAGHEKTLEALQSVASSTTAAAQDFVRILFDMLVSSRRRCEQRREQLELAVRRERSKDEAIEELRERLATTQRLHDKDLTKAVTEYEEKLTGLLEHSNVGQLMNIDEAKFENTAGNFLSGDLPLESVEKFRTAMALAEERNNALKRQLELELSKAQEMQAKMAELRASGSDMRRQLTENQHTIQFLEEECRMLREMAEEFKSRLKLSGGALGESIIRQVREADQLRRGDNIDLDDDEDNDTQSVLGEFSSLADEIHRTGGVVALGTGMSALDKPSLQRHNLMSNNLSNNASIGGGSSSNQRAISGGHNSIFDRLTNPSYFTGTQKNLFQQDLNVKRAKVKQIKKEVGEVSSRRRREHELHSNVAGSHHTQSNGLAGDTGSEDSNEAQGLPSNSQGDVFSRLVDPSNFTGIHRRRAAEESGAASLPPPPPTTMATINDISIISSQQRHSLRRKSPSELGVAFSFPKSQASFDEASTSRSNSFDISVPVIGVNSSASQLNAPDENTSLANQSQPLDHLNSDRLSSDGSGDPAESMKKGARADMPLEEVGLRSSQESSGEAVASTSTQLRRSIKHAPNCPPPDYLTF